MVWKARAKKFGILWLATGSGAGYLPIAPGTFGSLVGVFLLAWLSPVPLILQIGFCVGVGLLGVWAAQEAGKIFRVADAGYIVIDEIVGVWVTLLAIPITPFTLVSGFLIFRFFDVFKLPPAHYFDQHWKNGWGVMLDDVVAGIYGNILLHLILRAQI